MYNNNYNSNFNTKFSSYAYLYILGEVNKYIKEVEEADFTYTYQGDENTFEAIKEKGIRGYVFLPNVDTDLAYLVDKDSGNIYYFHPSGYFEKLQ